MIELDFFFFLTGALCLTFWTGCPPPCPSEPDAGLCFAIPLASRARRLSLRNEQRPHPSVDIPSAPSLVRQCLSLAESSQAELLHGTHAQPNSTTAVQQAASALGERHARSLLEAPVDSARGPSPASPSRSATSTAIGGLGARGGPTEQARAR